MSSADGSGGRPRFGIVTDRSKPAWVGGVMEHLRVQLLSTNRYAPAPSSTAVSATSATSVTVSRARIPRITVPGSADGLVARAADGLDQLWRAGSTSILARRRWIATSTRRESPR